MTGRVNVLRFTRRARPPDRTRVAEFVATAVAAGDHSSAHRLVQRILKETPPGEWPELGNRADFRTPRIVEYLIELSDATGARGADSLLIAEIAKTAAESLPDDAMVPVVTAQLRARAWTAHARCLAHVERFSEALWSLKQADRHVMRLSALAYDRATVSLVRAGVLQQLERFDDAEAILVTCHEVFRDHGDVRGARAAEALLSRRARPSAWD